LHRRRGEKQRAPVGFGGFIVSRSRRERETMNRDIHCNRSLWFPIKETRMTARRTQRRDFLKQSAAAGLGFWVGGGVTLGADKERSPLERLNIAAVGVGGKGRSDAEQAAKVGNLIAICDIDDNHLDSFANHKTKEGELPFRAVEKFNDFREMLDKRGKEIDAVVVSTPDHTHAPASVMAMRMKKHVYCQKPMTHSVYEARLMRELAREMGVCTQMGNQGSAENGLREAVEIIQAGAIGNVTEAHIWTNRPIWPQAPGVTSRPKETPEVPKHVHWDLFLGPAPERPYSPAYHPFKWRGWWDFGTGALGDMGCHTANMAFRALKLGHPTSLVAVSDPINPETYPGWAHVTYEFPARGDMGAVRVHWYEGRKDGELVLPSKELQAKVLKQGEKLPGSGSLLVGDKGILYSPNDYGAAYRLLPQQDFADYKKPEPKLPRNGKGDLGMKEEWAQAIKDRKPQIAYSNFDNAGMLTEFILLGNVAIRAGGKKLMWDGPNFKISNESAANDYLRTEYRKGWKL
jgi:predicted dehydrogenase